MRWIGAAAALLLLPAIAAAQTTVYQNDFETAPLGPEWSGIGSRQSTAGLSAFGFGQTHLRNDGQSATVLSIGGLAAHTSMTLSFDLAMWDSIDWLDFFRVSADGTELFNGPFGNYFTPSGECEGPGTVLTPPFQNFFEPNYGYGANRDCARSVSFTFAHSTSTVVIGWQYAVSQTGLDESFGIDNIRVQTNAAQSVVPEPSTYALLATGLGAIGAIARRRRRPA